MMNEVFTDSAIVHPEIERLKKENDQLQALLVAVLMAYDGREIRVSDVNMAMHKVRHSKLPSINWAHDAIACDTVVWLKEETL